MCEMKRNEINDRERPNEPAADKSSPGSPRFVLLLASNHCQKQQHKTIFLLRIDVNTKTASRTASSLGTDCTKLMNLASVLTTSALSFAQSSIAAG